MRVEHDDLIKVKRSTGKIEYLTHAQISQIIERKNNHGMFRPQAWRSMLLAVLFLASVVAVIYLYAENQQLRVALEQQVPPENLDKQVDMKEVAFIKRQSVDLVQQPEIYATPASADDIHDVKATSQVLEDSIIVQRDRADVDSDEDVSPIASYYQEQGREEISADEQQQIRSQLVAWAAAWSKQNTDSYFSHYSTIFESDSPWQKELAVWRAHRQKRIQSPSWIKVSVEDVEMQSQDKHYKKVKFKQRYQTDGYNDVTKKEMLFVLEQSQWKIFKESVIRD